MRTLGNRPFLFVDETLTDTHAGTTLRLHHPRREETALVADAPWEGPDSAYFVVVDAGERIGETERYRLYYRGMAGGSDWERTVACVAESADGIAWKRRLTWKYPAAGSMGNNIIWTDERNVAHNFCPFRDMRPGVPEDARFKAVGGLSEHGLFALASPDGIAWRLLSEEPVVRGAGKEWTNMEVHPAIRGLALDSLNVPFWDGERGCYVLYVRDWRGARTVMSCTSDDFLHWSAPEWIDFGEGELEHFYTNAIQPYPRDPGLRLGFPKRFMQDRARFPEIRDKGVSDAVLISSRDGIAFPRRFREAFIRPGLDQANWTHRNMMVAPGLIRTSPTEYSIYWSEHYAHHDARLARGTIRVDGFASLHADWPAGEWRSQRVKLDGTRLVLNLSTSAMGSARVGIEDAEGKPIPGFALADSDELFGDDIARDVTWKGSADIARPKGETVRLRIALVDADVFSIACAG